MAGESEVLVLLRHALAGTKLADPELDFVRGLNAAGRATANGVPNLVFEYVRPSLLVSSPFARCVETMNPLAEGTLLPVFARDELTPAAPPGAFERLLLSVPDGAVLCTHGEVITRVFEGLECEKGAFWVVDRECGRLRPARYVAPTAYRRATGILSARITSASS